MENGATSAATMRANQLRLSASAAVETASRSVSDEVGSAQVRLTVRHVWISMFSPTARSGVFETALCAAEVCSNAPQNEIRSLIRHPLCIILPRASL